jgi:hypothetical protein
VDGGRHEDGQDVLDYWEEGSHSNNMNEELGIGGVVFRAG